MTACKKSPNILLPSLQLNGFFYIGLFKGLFKQLFFNSFLLVLHTIFVISVPSERFPSLPGSNTGSFERLPSVSNALKFGFSWSLVSGMPLTFSTHWYSLWPMVWLQYGPEKLDWSWTCQKSDPSPVIMYSTIHSTMFHLAFEFFIALQDRHVW